MVVEVVPAGEGRLLRLESGDKVRVVVGPLVTEPRVELHAITPTSTVIVELTDPDRHNGDRSRWDAVEEAARALELTEQGGVVMADESARSNALDNRRVLRAIEQWYADFGAEGGRTGKGSKYVIDRAEEKARFYREMGTAYDDFQPGNGTSYKLVLHDMIAPYVRLMVERDRDEPGHPEDEEWLLRLAYYIHRQGMSEADLWEYAARHTMAAYAGGELLVSLPENGGRCAVLSVHEGALLTPDYIAERLNLRWGDAVPLAAYLTSFVDAVATTRAAAIDPLSVGSGVTDA